MEDEGVYMVAPSAELAKASSDDGTLPTVHRETGFRFHFYLADRGEPPHIHVMGGGGRAKIWLRPLRVQRSARYSRRQIGQIIRIVEAHREEWLKAWSRHFGQP